jgi:hypothetical protein
VAGVWLALSGLAVALLVLAGIELAEHGRKGQPRLMRLHFGRDVTSDAVVAMLDGVAGLPAGVTIALEVHAAQHEIAHYLRAEQAVIDHLRGSLRALMPSARLEPVQPDPPGGYGFGRGVRLRGGLRVLRDDLVAETSAGLLAALQPLGRDERLLVRWLIRPGRAAVVPERAGSDRLGVEARRRLRLKNQGSVLRVRGLVAVEAGGSARAAHLLGRVAAVLRSRSTAYGRLSTYFLPRWWLKRELTHGRLVFGDRFSAGELAGLLGWPIEAPVLPGLTLGTAPLLMPSPRLPSQGRLLGRATWPGMERKIFQPVIGALSHTLIAGPTGTGKSTLLTNLMAGDLMAGRGLVLIDGKGDTASAVLARVPAERQDDVIALDCASAGAQPGIRLFDGREPELAADVVLGVLSELFRDSWGPLSERYLRAGLSLVAHDPEGTLADVPYVFSDPAYRRRLAGRLSDPLTRATLAGFEAMSAAERAQQLAAPLNKLGTLLSRPIVRSVLGQAAPRLDFSTVLRQRKIVVVSLAPGRVGGPAAQLIGALCLFALFRAVQGRSGLAEPARRPFFVYLDEPKALGSLPMPLDLLLEQARGLGVGVVIAPQSVTQLPRPVREAVLTNAATRIVFRQEADDARLTARDLSNVTPEELGDLGQHEVVARIGLGPGDVAAPVTLRTLPAGLHVSDPATLAAASARAYGRTLREVDGELAARHQAGEGVPVGRKARGPA